MTFIDTVIVIVVLGGLAVGFSRGITRSLGSLAAIVVAVLACRTIGRGQSIPANILIFAAAYAVVMLLSSAIHKIVKMTFLKPLDRLLGAVFVAAEYIVGLSLLMNLWIWLRSMTSTPETAWTGDVWAQKVIDAGPWLMGCLSTLSL
ncbi:MAG TPA: CvpA family protein [Candidatus Amulumruptor caecigallinarius]|uniref:CvpA family protein n=1 Tax=Candidatus Amulumruptor caecigallinarius TaxID=2109911 RepID=A0A921E9A3_9BACT|nr:CvpA family protein [Candidatus Amulumruptor caecigallinarius]